MALRDDLDLKLQTLHSSGQTLPASVQASDGGLTLRIEVTAIDTLSCAFSELVLFVPQLQNAQFDVVKQWATDLSKRITYLLENIGPLEFDPTAGEVLIRSTPPSQLPNGSQYYEIVLSSSGTGSFVLKRFKSIAGQPGRVGCDIQLTREVLLRLVDDLLATLASTP